MGRSFSRGQIKNLSLIIIPVLPLPFCNSKDNFRGFLEGGSNRRTFGGDRGLASY